jgi:hypothetical protein
VTTISAAHHIIVEQQVRGGAVPPPPLRFLKLLQVWSGWRLDDVLGVCHALGFTGILVKALDGLSWMNAFDDSPDALGSLFQLGQEAARARLEGLYFFCWTNPLTQTTNDLAFEATITGQIARTCDGLFLDVEPYNQFWGPNAPAGMASQFMQWVRAEAPDAFIALQPDPRPGALQGIRIDDWLPYVDALSGQHYWSDFDTDPTAELAQAVALGQQYGIPILPTLPGNAPLSGFPMGSIAALPGFVVWRYGSTPETTLEQLGSCPVTGINTRRIAVPA